MKELFSGTRKKMQQYPVSILRGFGNQVFQLDESGQDTLKTVIAVVVVTVIMLRIRIGGARVKSCPETKFGGEKDKCRGK